MRRKMDWKKSVLSAVAASVVVCSAVPSATAANLPQERLVTDSRAEALNGQNIEAFADSFFEREEIKAFNVHSASLVVVKDGKVLLDKDYGYGVKGAAKSDESEGLVYRIASVSKTIAATAVMQLAEQGKIDLQQDVQTYLGNIKLNNKTDTSLTMEHLLTHTSGFDVVDPPQGEMITLDLSLVYEMKDYIRTYLPTIVNKPGSTYKYDNFASMLQGYIVEQVSGQPFHQYVEEHIFKPLGMNDSSFLLTDEMQKRLVPSFAPDGQELPQINTLPTDMPQGGMMTTGSDMAKFMIAHLNKGKLGDARMLQEATVEDMHKAQVSIHPKVPVMTYGFEFSQQHYGRSDVIVKGGDIPGYSSLMWMLPEQQTGVFIVYNNNSELRSLLFDEFLARYFPAEPTPEFVTLTPAQLARLEGAYRDRRVGYMIADVKVQDGALTLRDLLGTRVLRAVDPLLFIDESGKVVAFKENEDGTIAFLSSSSDPSAWWERLPEPGQLADVGSDHLYAEYINEVRQMEIVHSESNESGLFHPDKPITRAELAVWIMNWLGAPPSANMPPFKDTAEHPDAVMIKSAFDFGIIVGNEQGMFYPDRPVTRQEAALMVMRISSQLGHVPQAVKLAGESDSWAEEAVRYIVGTGFYGPDVVTDEDGAIDYRATDIMKREEAAALLYGLAKASLEI